jgi:hypothetical protein
LPWPRGVVTVARRGLLTVFENLPVGGQRVLLVSGQPGHGLWLPKMSWPSLIRLIETC